MARLLSKKYDKNKQILIAELENVKHVSTAADSWTSHRRTFLGMTAHWHGEGKTQTILFVTVRVLVFDASMDLTRTTCWLGR
jgi:hypothetical protein